MAYTSFRARGATHTLGRMSNTLMPCVPNALRSWCCNLRAETSTGTSTLMSMCLFTANRSRVGAEPAGIMCVPQTGQSSVADGQTVPIKLWQIGHVTRRQMVTPKSRTT